jgi:hypothetical protein
MNKVFVRVLCYCQPKETISNTFFKFDGYEPNIVCNRSVYRHVDRDWLQI